MTATPTPLRELPAKLREEAAGKTDTAYEEGRVAEKLRCARLIEAALSARDEAGGVAYDRELVADMLGELVYDEGYGPKSRSAYTVEAIEEQVRLLRNADNAEAARVGTSTIATPPASGEAGAWTPTDADVREWVERNDLGAMNATDARAAVDDARSMHMLPTPPAASGDDEAFADWLAKEMPPSTVISNPRWWAPRILRATRRLAAVAPAGMVQEAKPLPGLWVRRGSVICGQHTYECFYYNAPGSFQVYAALPATAGQEVS